MTSSTGTTAGRPFDFKDPDTWASGVPHERIAEIRRSDPVYWNDEADGPGFWAVLRHEDIFSISRQPKVFSSATANGGHRIFNENEVSLANTNQENLGSPFISIDPPLHQQRRVQLVPPLSQLKLKQMAARIQDRATALFESIEPGREVEWVETISAPFPLMTLVELLDVSPEDWKKLYHWTNAFVGEDDPDFRASPEDMADRMGEFGAYMAWLFESRRKSPGEDIASILANAEFDGREADFNQFLADMILVTVGGNETVRNSISNGLCAFVQYPDQWDIFSGSEEARITGVQEIVRYASPVLHMRRTAMADVKISGTEIRKGDKVVLWYISGNRDEDAFENPDTFDVTRLRNKHVGFGTGQHVCLGQRVAELQLRTIFGEMSRRYKGFEITSEPARLRSNFINGIKSLKIIPAGRT